MFGQNDARHGLSAEALVKAMAEFHLCWPHWWWELKLAQIHVGDRLIQGGLPDPWRAADLDLRAAVASRAALAALNPQPLPPLPSDIAVGLEIADRLIGMASAAHTLQGWLAPAARHDGPAVAARLADEVEELCRPPWPVLKLKIHPHPWPGPDPDPIITHLTPLAHLAMAARFNAAATAATHSGPFGQALAGAAQRLQHSGLQALAA